MEQQLINALMKLLAKAGGGELVKDLIQKVDTNGNPKQWTPAEISAAVEYVTHQTERFGAHEASLIIETLQRKYQPSSDASADQPLNTTAGIKGLQ